VRVQIGRSEVQAQHKAGRREGMFDSACTINHYQSLSINQSINQDVLTVVKVLDTVPKTYELSDGTVVYGEHAQKLNDKQVDVLTKPKQTKKAKSSVDVARTVDDGIATRTRSRYPHMVTG
jgi:beta-glucanase (GH16 family)